MLQETKREIQDFVLKIINEMNAEDFMKAVHREYPRYEHMGYALHLYIQSKQAEWHSVD